MRRSAIAWLGAAATLAIGLTAAVLRNLSVAAMASSTPHRAVATLVATVHAQSARIAWTAATIAAAAIAVDALAVAIRSPRASPAPTASASASTATSAPPPAPSPTPPRAWGLPLFAGLLWCCAPFAPPLIVVSGPVLLCTLAIRRHPTPAVFGRVAAASLCAAVAAAAAAEGSLYDLLRLVPPSDAGRVDVAAAIRGIVAVAALAAAALALWLHPRRITAALAALAALALATERTSTTRAMAYAPPRALASVRPLLPADRPDRIARPIGGCLVQRAADGAWSAATIGWTTRQAGALGCPERPLPGGFPPHATPLLALAPDAPVDDLLGWHEGGAGEVLVLTRVGGGFAMPAWRVALRRIGAWRRPGERRTKPLPGAVLLYGEASGVWIAGAGVPSEVATDDPASAARAALDGRVRSDLLIHRSVVETVGEVVALCGAGVPAGAGVRCVVVDGDPGAWAKAIGVGTAPG